MTIHLTLHGLWTVGKYLLAFGAGFATCFVLVARFLDEWRAF